MRFLLGLGIGYALGLIIAPASGDETRRAIVEKADEFGREKAKELGQRMGETAYERITRGA
jgi:gas vesicle protein